MSAKATYLNDDLYQYLLDISVRENLLIDEGNKITNQQIGIPMQSSLEQLNFLNWFVSSFPVTNILEIGTYTGLSALAMAQALPEEGKIICLDSSEEFTAIAKMLWQKAELADKIKLHIGEAKDFLTTMSAQHQTYFDLIFIDADKVNYHYYYETGLSLLKSGGVLMIDNVLWHGDVINKQNTKASTVAIRKFNQYLYTDKRVKITLLPFGDGLTLATKC